MEASGLDFGASGPQFWSFQAPLVERKGFFLTSRGSACFLNRFGRFFRSAHVSLKCMTAPHHSRPKWIPHMQAFNEPQSPKFHASKLGRRRWAPPGGFNPPATEGVPTACRIEFKLALSNHSWPISTFFRTIRSEVFFPLSFPFPRSLGTTANPTPKSGKVGFFRIFSRFFRLPNRA